MERFFDDFVESLLLQNIRGDAMSSNFLNVCMDAVDMDLLGWVLANQFAI